MLIRKNINVYDLNFGSLANQKFKIDRRYLQWKDGVDRSEMKDDWIEHLANEIADIYGMGNVTVSGNPLLVFLCA